MSPVCCSGLLCSLLPWGAKVCTKMPRRWAFFTTCGQFFISLLNSCSQFQPEIVLSSHQINFYKTRHYNFYYSEMDLHKAGCSELACSMTWKMPEAGTLLWELNMFFNLCCCIYDSLWLWPPEGINCSRIWRGWGGAGATSWIVIMTWIKFSCFHWNYWYDWNTSSLHHVIKHVLAAWDLWLTVCWLVSCRWSRHSPSMWHLLDVMKVGTKWTSR